MKFLESTRLTANGVRVDEYLRTREPGYERFADERRQFLERICTDTWRTLEGITQSLILEEARPSALRYVLRRVAGVKPLKVLKRCDAKELMEILEDEELVSLRPKIYRTWKRIDEHAPHRER